MERRYLITILAVAGTFAALSHGMRSLQQHPAQLAIVAGEMSALSCSSFSNWAAKLRDQLQPGRAEQAQLLAEMNLPMRAAQSQAAEQAMRQSESAVQCARERALREAERARRDAMRAHEKMALEDHRAMAVPMAFSDAYAQRIQIKTTALANRMVAQQVRLQLAADRLQSAAAGMAYSDLAGANVRAYVNSGRRTSSRCAHSQAN